MGGLRGTKFDFLGWVHFWIVFGAFGRPGEGEKGEGQGRRGMGVDERRVEFGGWVRLKSIVGAVTVQLFFFFDEKHAGDRFYWPLGSWSVVELLEWVHLWKHFGGLGWLMFWPGGFSSVF